MKKLLLLVAAALTATGLNTAAAQFQVYPTTVKPAQKVASVKNVESRAGEKSLEVSYCGDDVMAIGLGNTYNIGGAIQIPAGTAAAYEGNKITKVKIGLGQILSDTKIEVFVAKRLNGMYISKEQFDVPAMAVDQYGYGQWVEFTLNEPYEISTTAFYVGFIVTPSSSQDYPIGVDGISPSSDYGNHVYVYDSQARDYKWYRMPELGLDANMNIRAVVEGDNLPGNEMELSSVYVPAFVKGGEAFELQGSVMNKGVNDVTTFEVSYQLGDMAPVAKTIEASIKSGEQFDFSITDAVYNGAAGVNIPAIATITKVNGEEDANVDNNTASGSFWSGDKMFDRIVVVEEATGSTCGFCPRGIVGLEYMNKTYPETFIGIAAHYSLFGPDPMETTSYAPMTPNSLPMGIINRVYADDPNAEYLEIYYNIERARPSFANVDITSVSFNEGSTELTVETKTEFAVDAADVDYRLAYVVLENEVGPYSQSNYYAGGGYGVMGGWESKPDPASTIYQDVARDIFDYEGIRNSVPQNLAAGEKYDYSYTVDLRNVTNVNNMEIAVLLIDAGGSGEILNAKKLTSKEIAGITDVEIELNENAPAVYYNLQGVQVPAENMAPGLYVKRQGNKAEKVIIR